MRAAAIDNTGGMFYSKEHLMLNADGALTNASGVIQSDAALSVAASGAVNNHAGRIEANGGAAQLHVSGSSIDNTSGRMVNGGTGATTIDGGNHIANDAGTIGGDGDVRLASGNVSNTRQGQVIAKGAGSVDSTRERTSPRRLQQRLFYKL